MGPQAKITRVETIPIAVPFRVPFKIASGGARPIGENMLVLLSTDLGLIGIGETQAWRRQGSVETLASLKCAIDDHLAPRVVGQSPFQLAAIVAAMDAALYAALYAKAGIIDALYDLQGKLLDVPVYALLGGKFRDVVGACAVLPIKPSLEETLEVADAFNRRGFRSPTVKVGVDPEAEVTLVRAVRERFPAAIIRVDANASMGFDDALALLKRLEPFGLDAAEQMVPMWDMDGLAELARRIDIPMMADECVGSTHDLLDVIKHRAARPSCRPKWRRTAEYGTCASSGHLPRRPTCASTPATIHAPASQRPRSRISRRLGPARCSMARSQWESAARSRRTSCATRWWWRMAR